MADTTLLWVGTCGMAALAALLDNSLPPRLRPWWRAMPRFSYAPPPARAHADLHAEADALESRPAQVQPVVQGVPEFNPDAPQLMMVETVDRRQQSLPFVGRDRRKVGSSSVQAPQAERREGNGR